MPPNTVKVCRPTKYGNPHRVGFCPVCGVEHTQAEAVEEFRAMLELAEIPADLSELRGKNLACWCKEGTPCHADVLLDMANDAVKRGHIRQVTRTTIQERKVVHYSEHAPKPALRAADDAGA